MTERPASAHLPSNGGASVVTLEHALERETRLLLQLATVLRRQREGISCADTQVIDDSVFAARRVIRTLEEARRHRRTVAGMLAGAPDVALHELDAALGSRMTAELRATRDRLHEVARLIEADVATTREALRSTAERASTSAALPGVAPGFTSHTTTTGEETVC